MEQMLMAVFYVLCLIYILNNWFVPYVEDKVDDLYKCLECKQEPLVVEHFFIYYLWPDGTYQDTAESGCDPYSFMSDDYEIVEVSEHLFTEDFDIEAYLYKRIQK